LGGCRVVQVSTRSSKTRGDGTNVIPVDTAG
jgi:hypothetical protein